MAGTKGEQTFTIQTSDTETTSVQTENQTILVFPPDVFDVPTRTTIRIKVKEFYRMEDIIAQNLNTQTTDDQLLVSGGMVYVDA